MVKQSLMVYLLSALVVLALVYYFRPSTFNFLKFSQGFQSDDGGDDVSDFEDEGFQNEDGSDDVSDFEDDSD